MTDEKPIELSEEDNKDLKEILENRRHRKWIVRNGHYLVKGLVFLITSWILFENFIKHLLLKIIH